MSDLDDLKIKLVRKMAMNNVTGNHKKQIDTVKQWGVASHDQGKAEQALKEMASDLEAPVELYGGRDVIRLTSISEAKKFIAEKGGKEPFWL